MNPFFLTGLIDAEGSFNISIVINKTRTLGWRVEPRLKIGLHDRDLPLLLQVRQILGGIGLIHTDPSRKRAIYLISPIKDLIKLITHLEKYPLLTPSFFSFFFFFFYYNNNTKQAPKRIGGRKFWCKN
jgi:hypothetical protein